MISINKFQSISNQIKKAFGQISTKDFVVNLIFFSMTDIKCMPAGMALSMVIIPVTTMLVTAEILTPVVVATMRIISVAITVISLVTQWKGTLRGNLNGNLTRRFLRHVI